MLRETKLQIKRLFGPKYDGVIEAVHYKEDVLAWVRAYERRGPTWSDLVMLDRATLVQRLEDGFRFRIGKRLKSQASEFETGAVVHISNSVIVTEDITDTSKDQLKGAAIL